MYDHFFTQVCVMRVYMFVDVVSCVFVRVFVEWKCRAVELVVIVGRAFNAGMSKV